MHYSGFECFFSLHSYIYFINKIFENFCHWVHYYLRVCKLCTTILNEFPALLFYSMEQYYSKIYDTVIFAVGFITV